ncbi:hypothetical protein ACFZAM_07520 [Streptomyces sp. NPDC008079]|uniref:hypothetical protein n=1 Tax=unclassified Streptomyces TaxID=2593676 RepID=UPI0033A72D2F
MSTTHEPEAEAAEAEAPQTDASGAAAPDEAEANEAAAGRRWRWPYGARRTAAVAAIVLLLLGGGGFGYAAHRLTDPAATDNRALTDTEATNRVVGDVSNALGKIFAYTPEDTGSTERAARDLLDGAAADQYQALFGQIRQRVAEQQLTLTTRVVRAGVVRLTADHARLLVFLDQTAQRKGAAATSAAAQLSVTARLDGDHWRITDLKAR